MKDFSTADGTGDGNAATHLVATHWHTRSHSTCNTTATQKHPPVTETGPLDFPLADYAVNGPDSLTVPESAWP